MATTMRFTPPRAVEPAMLPGSSPALGSPTPLVWRGSRRGPWTGLREIALSVGAGAGILCLAATALVLLAGVTPLVVRSGSMEPDLPVGSLAVTRQVPAAEVAAGDVVSVVLPDGTRVTHRVVDAEPMSTGTHRLTLQGDANEGPDAEPVVVTEVDRLIVTVPGLGRLVEQLGHPRWTFAAGLLSGLALLSAFGPATVARVGAWVPDPRHTTGRGDR